MATNEDYAKRAVELGHTVISSCEHGTMGNVRECYDLAKKYGLKWRYVAEAYFVKDRFAEDSDGRKDRKNCHIILAAKTAKGMGDLNEVLSEANISGYYFRPRVDMELLMKLDPKDVFITTACIAGLWAYGHTVDKIPEALAIEAENKEIERVIASAEDPRGSYLNKVSVKNIAYAHQHQELLELCEGIEWEPIKTNLLKIRDENYCVIKQHIDSHYNWDEPDKLVKQLHAHFGDSFMLEVQPHNVDKQKIVNIHILNLYRKEGIKIIAGMDSHFIYPEEAELRRMRLEANHIVYEDEEGWSLDYPSDEEAVRRFEEQGVLSAAQIKEAMDNTNVFLDFEDIEFDKGRKLPTIYPNLTQEERNQKYRDLVYAKWDEYKQGIPPERWPEYEAGIEYEVNTITSTNTSDYFLLDYEWIQKAKSMGGQLTRTGRGSAPSYFTNTLLGFSSIDRFALPITMYPDRFISADRLKTGTPDIDMNVSDQGLFGDAMAAVMGDWHCAPMIAYGTLKRLSAWKMYCRANNVPFEIANEPSDNLKAYELDLKHADDDEKDDIDVLNYVPEKYHEYLKASEKYLGMVDSISPHPCAYLLSNQDIRREIGIFRINSKTGAKKVVFAAFIDGATADAYGYLKNDDLQVTVVKLNADIYSRIGIPQPSVPELLKMTEGDKATWDMYANGYTLGLNQTEKEKSTEKVMRYKPHNISELSAFVAGIRPAFQSMVNKLLNRENFSYGIPALDKLLQTKELPQSFILYQEQMMKVLQWSGFTAPESYASIKAIAKKHPEKVLPLKEKFLTGFSQRLIREEGVPEIAASDTANQVWTIISDACGYGFNSCLIGSTKMMRPSNKGRHGFNPTIREMYLIRNDRGYASATGHLPLYIKYRRNGYGKALSLCADGRIRENNIVDIRYAGHRPVFKVRTASGLEVVCTDNHKFPIGSSDHLVELKDIHVGDKLFVHGQYEKHPDTYRFTDGNYESNVPKKGERGFQRNENGPCVLYKNTRDLMIRERCACEHCGRPYSEEACFEVHHIDGDRTNNTLENFAWLCNSCHKKAHYEMGRTKRYEKGIPSWQDEIVAIDPAGEEDVYDVEMAAPDHNFVLENGLVVGNSHSTAVALDSLYTAWAKAHYPYETYVSLLSLYAEKKDKDRIAKAKVEMFKAFGIRIVPCKFRQDNRSYFVDKDAHTISDALTSVKGVSAAAAKTLYAMRNNVYPTAIDLFYDLDVNTSINCAVVISLIKMGYFEEFGSSGKLLKLYDEFRNGASKFSKAHVAATQAKRLDALRQLEKEMPDTEIPMPDQMAFEVEYYGTPLSVYPADSGCFAVLEVDDRYSPKMKLYNVAKGTTGVMKVRKPVYKRAPVQEGDVIRLIGWKRKPAYQYVDGKQTIKTGVFDLWIDEYEIISSAE